MILIAIVLSSFVLGAAGTAFYLRQRWSAAAAEVEQAMKDTAEQHQAVQTENRDLKQKIADLEYQLNSVRKDLDYERQRHSDT